MAANRDGPANPPSGERPSGERPSGERPAGDPAGRDVPPPDPKLLAQRRAAVLSLYFHIRGPGIAVAALLHPLFHPLPVDEAIQIVLSDTSERADWVRRRVIAKAAAAGMHLNPAFRALFDKVPDGKEQPRSALLPEKRLDELSRFSIESGLYGVLPVAHDCVLAPPLVDVHANHRTLVTTSRIELRVKIPFERVIQILDPRAWPRCSDFFEDTFRVATTPDGDPIPEDCGWKRHPAGDPAPGERWRGMLYERFVFNWNHLQTMRSENLLLIDQSGPAGTTWTAKYSMYKSLELQTFFVVRPGGIDVDSGFIQVDRIGPQLSNVIAVKNIRFTDMTQGNTYPSGPLDFGETMNYLTPAMSSAWIEQSTSDLICCQHSH